MMRTTYTRIMSQVALPMYDFPFLRETTDVFWRDLRQLLVAAGISQVPEQVWRPANYKDLFAGDRELLLAQVCGYDLVTAPADSLVLLGSPSYGWEGCEKHFHSSFHVVRESDQRNDLKHFTAAKVAINYPDSNSGFAAFREAMAGVEEAHPFSGSILWTGSHEASLQAVAAAKADLATVDCISYALLQRSEAAIPGLRVLGQTKLFPAPPFVCSATVPATTQSILRAALAKVLAGEAPYCRELGLSGFSATTRDDFAPILQMNSISLW